ncbi:MAG TPA: nucleotidyltransferase family protein [Verrucomicrobiae bacterium]|jgi:molybdenum cofactor cytidylyltransferase
MNNPAQSSAKRPGATRIGVVLLAAGASARMGRPKLLLPWGKTTVIGHLLAQWQQLKAAQVAVVGRRADRPLTSELRRLDFPLRQRIVNSTPEQGMFSSIVCAARWKGWDANLTAWVIALGDQPHLRAATLRSLLKCHCKHPEAVCQPVFAGHRCHPVVLPRAAFLALHDCPARTLKEFLHQTDVPSVECSVDDSGLMLDMDYPADYKKLSPKGFA